MARLPHARVQPLMRALGSLVGKLLLLFIVLEIADVPFICADERPAKEISSPVVLIVDGLDSVALSTPSANIDDGDPCFCPCHSNFRSATASDLPSSGRSAELIETPRTRGVPAPTRSLDHPPQNLL